MTTRWAGVPASRRRDERREMLVRAAFGLFGAGGEAVLTVRAVCREAELHTRYFYENFTDTGELLAAVYDRQAEALGEVLASALEEAGQDPEARTRAGVRDVLRFISDDTATAAASCSPRRPATSRWPRGAGRPRRRCWTGSWRWARATTRRS
ncbi:TetR/AcrR family transcriptional regulator [Actinomadura sp. CNU-125]|uniref:TetR/AcrR family transcriptional regulator n=1 Tax=Actinomadura sp. CNU-125 TaxID=1904961 RepID=UPI000A5B2DF4|nr:hypothetical protein [Actinomadura sp. CNU-125]